MNSSITPAELINSGHVVSYVLNLVNRILTHLEQKNPKIKISHSQNGTDKSLAYTFKLNELDVKITFHSLAIHVVATHRDETVYKKNSQIAYGDPYVIYTREIDSLYSYINNYDNTKTNEKQINSLTADLEQTKDSTHPGPETVDENPPQPQTVGNDSGKLGSV